VIARFSENGFDYIIVDASPLTKDSDARFVARCVDGTVLVVHAGKSRRHQLAASVALLGDSRLLGYALFAGRSTRG